jgi:hypothetical protein
MLRFDQKVTQAGRRDAPDERTTAPVPTARLHLGEGDREPRRRSRPTRASAWSPKRSRDASRGEG